MAPGFGTPAVALATTPTVLSTFFSHVLNRKSRSKAAKKSLAEGGPGAGPEDDLTYEEGLKVVRRFIDFASHHGVEEVQAFTAMPIPTPGKCRHRVFNTALTRSLGQQTACDSSGGDYHPGRRDHGRTSWYIWSIGGKRRWHRACGRQQMVARSRQAARRRVDRGEQIGINSFRCSSIDAKRLSSTDSYASEYYCRTSLPSRCRRIFKPQALVSAETTSDDGQHQG